jgi:hypothetical protein
MPTRTHCIIFFEEWQPNTHIHCHPNTTMRWAGMMADGTMMDTKVGQMGTNLTDEGNLFCGMAQDLR